MKVKRAGLKVRSAQFGITLRGSSKRNPPASRSSGSWLHGPAAARAARGHAAAPPMSVMNSRRFTSFDHLVGEQKKRISHCKAERLRGYQIDDQFKLGRRLHRQVSRFFAPQEAVDIRTRTPKNVGRIRPIRD